MRQLAQIWLVRFFLLRDHIFSPDFILYELAKNPTLVEKLNKELQRIEGCIHIESLKLLDACIMEGLQASGCLYR
jgi:hypothetical protein